MSSGSGISHGSELLARKPSDSIMTGVVARTASRAASMAMSKQSAGLCGANHGDGAFAVTAEQRLEQGRPARFWWAGRCWGRRAAR
jgi:hypothetical protein